jgi:hypothetical protein
VGLGRPSFDTADELAQLESRVDAEFGVRLAQMGFHGVRRKVKLLGDIPIDCALGRRRTRNPCKRLARVDLIPHGPGAARRARGVTSGRLSIPF